MAIDVKFLKGTAEQYAAITPVATTFYLAGDDVYLGAIKLSNAGDLTAAVSALENGAVKSNTEAIEALEKLVGELPSEATEGATVVSYLKGLIDANASAIATEKQRAEGAESDLQDAIDAINDSETGILATAEKNAHDLVYNSDETAKWDVAGSGAAAQKYTDDKIGVIPEKVGETNTNTVKAYIDAKAAEVAANAGSDLSDLEDRVSTNEDAIETITGEGEGSIKNAVNTAVTNLIDGAPEALDTLKEIADWIANQDENGVTDVASLVARVDTLSGADTVPGSVAKAEKDAKEYADGLDQAMDARVDALEEAIGENGSVATQIEEAINKLDTVDGGATDTSNGVTVTVTQEDGVVTSVDVEAPDFANLYDAKGDAAQALTDAKAYTDNALTWGAIA